MSIIVSTLPSYVADNNQSLIRNAVMGSKSAKMFALQTGVKKESALNLLNTSVTLQDGSDCGWDDAGTSSVSQRTISAPLLKVNQSFCDKTLIGKSLEHDVRIAAGQKTLPFEEDFIGGVLEDVQSKSENLIWQGDTTGSGYLALSDGLIKIMGASSQAALTHTAITTPALAKTAIDAIVTAIPATSMKKAKVFVGYDIYKLYIMQLQVLNLFHNDGDGLSGDSVTYQGSTMTIEAVDGLTGTGVTMATDPENFFYGTDLMGDTEKFDFWYSKDNQEFRLVVEFNQGVQVAYPTEVTWSKNEA